MLELSNYKLTYTTIHLPFLYYIPLSQYPDTTKLTDYRLTYITKFIPFYTIQISRFHFRLHACIGWLKVDMYYCQATLLHTPLIFLFKIASLNYVWVLGGVDPENLASPYWWLGESIKHLFHNTARTRDLFYDGIIFLHLI